MPTQLCEVVANGRVGSPVRDCLDIDGAMRGKENVPIVNSEISKIMDAFGKSRFESIYLRVGDVELNLKKTDPVSSLIADNTGFAAKDSLDIRNGRAEASAAVKDAKTVSIKSPLMGLVRLAPASNEPPFVEVGATVEPGKVVALIDVLGTLSEVTALYKGRVTKILCQADQLVEFEQDLFELEISD